MDISNRKHVLVISFPAFGHIIPLLELGKKMAKFHRVTFAVSAVRIGDVVKRELISNDDHIEMLPIKDGFHDEDFPNIYSLPSFLALIRHCLPPVQNLVDSLNSKTTGSELGNVDVIIVDSFFSKAVIRCRQKNIPFYHFTTGSAGSNCMYLLPGESNDNLLPYSFEEFLMQVQGTFPLAAGVIVNSVKELEEEDLRRVKGHPAMAKINFFFTGPLVPGDGEKQDNNRQLQQQQVSDWLDRKEKNSVAYVGFGTVVSPSEDQVKELAKAFSLLGKPLIWSLPKSHQEFLPKHLKNQICQQFENEENQMLILTWAPQKVILSHPATAVFVSHCGWNSALEAFTGGIPIVGWPMFADQPQNAKFIVRRGIGVLVDGTGIEAQRIVPANEITELICKVAGWVDGNTTSSYKQTAQELANKIRGALKEPDGSSFVDFHQLMKFQ